MNTAELFAMDHPREVENTGFRAVARRQAYDFLKNADPDLLSKEDEEYLAELKQEFENAS